MSRAVSAVCLALVICLCAQPTAAQTMTAGADLFFYGDNTEFTNPFREGETLLGTAGRLFIEIDLNDTVRIRGGLFGNGRYGSHRFLEEAEPLIALELRREPSTIRFGSLETAATRSNLRGPDEETPHQLLPPLQRETLSFTRAHEMGLQWMVEASRLQHDLWINWQRLNTVAHRERFDTGYRARAALPRDLELHGQWHLVHEGGQQFASGPVRDSQAWALGLGWARQTDSHRVSLDTHAVLTRDMPDRGQLHREQTGPGGFIRGAIEWGPWRTHVIVWRSRDTRKDEGDANYLMMQLDGLEFRNVRDYAEWGVARHVRPAPGLHLTASARLHRIESHYEYSYRIVARVRLRHHF